MTGDVVDVPSDERAKTTNGPDPDPAVTPGQQPDGGISRGDTPPSADSMSGAVGGARDDTPNQGPVSGNRTPMIITLTVLGLIVLLAAGFIVASLIAQ